MCMSRPKAPKVERSAPPPMYVPESTSEEVKRTRTRERRRAASAYGRESTILGGGAGAGATGGPTAQAKTLLGS